MPEVTVGDATLHYELRGEGAPLVLVHGSWVDHHVWDLAVRRLARSFRVLRYDRRGHSASPHRGAQGAREDLADLEALIRRFEFAPANVVGNSFGATIALELAARAPRLFRAVVAHEPPIVGLVEDDPAVMQAGLHIRDAADLLRAGRPADAAKLFVDTIALEPGAWDGLPQRERDTFVANAATWLDEVTDPGSFMVAPAELARISAPVLLTGGDESPPFFWKILEVVHAAIPSSRLVRIAAAGHVPHLTQPDEWAASVTSFLVGG